LQTQTAKVEHTEELYDQVFDDTVTGYERWNRDSWMSVKFTKGMPFPNLPVGSGACERT
jgi:hypothetical protein